MGVCSAKDENKAMMEAVCPNDPEHIHIENQFAKLLNPKDPNNLNHKVEGVKETWDALRFACDNSDTSLIVGKLREKGIKLLHKSLQMSYDTQNFRYDIPIFMINDPTSYQEKKEEAIVEKDVKITLRAFKDYQIETSTSKPAKVLVDELAKHEKLEGKRVQLFFAGKQMEHDKPIGNFVKEDGVVTVFIRNAA